jgi:hypothetical protein
MKLPHHPALPSSAWKETFEKNFRNFRKVRLPIHKMARSVMLIKPHWQNINQVKVDPEVEARTKSMASQTPKLRDRDGWWEFINGKQITVLTASSKQEVEPLSAPEPDPFANGLGYSMRDGEDLDANLHKAPTPEPMGISINVTGLMDEDEYDLNPANKLLPDYDTSDLRASTPVSYPELQESLPDSAHPPTFALIRALNPVRFSNCILVLRSPPLSHKAYPFSIDDVLVTLDKQATRRRPVLYASSAERSTCQMDIPRPCTPRR